jgi:hypothetical protein
VTDQPRNDRPPGEARPAAADVRPAAETRPAGQAARSGEAGRTGQAGRRGQAQRTGQAGRTGQGGSDLVSDLQRWLIRSSAKNMGREFGAQVRKKLGGDRAEVRDVWETATTEPPPGDPGEAPECAWCPVCRAARRIRESGPGFGSQLAGAGDAVAAAVQEALGAFDTALSRTGPVPGGGGDRPPPATGSAGRTGSAGTGSAGTGSTRTDSAGTDVVADLDDVAVTHPEGHERAPGDRR